VGEEYILGFDEFLKSQKIKTILDYAGGIGFSVAALKNMKK